MTETNKKYNTQKKERIQRYSPDFNSCEFIELDLPDDDCINGCEDIRHFQGFCKEYRRISSSYSNEEECIFELCDYINLDGHHIVEIWDSFSCICQFYISNHLHYLHFIKIYISMRSEMFKYEELLNKLQKGNVR